MLGSTRWALVLLMATLAMGAASTAATAQCPRGEASVIEVLPAGTVQEVTLVGGATFVGRVVDAGDPVRFELASGDVLELRRERILCLRAIEGQIHEGQYWSPDPNATRLFFGPTGRALPRGEGYLSVFELIMPMVAFGVTDRLTLAGGMPLIFTDSGIELIWLAPKLEVIRTPTFRGSAGVLAFIMPGESESVGVLYGVGTLGRTADRAFTVGAGWGYSTEDGIYEWPAIMVGGESRLGRRVKLITENYLIPDEGVGLLSVGPRFFGDRLSADLGLAAPFGGGGFLVFPLINFVYNW
jgi:hypothetical protein